MTDEEKEAIDFTKYLVEDYKKQLDLLEKNGANNYGYSDEEIDVIKYRNKQFETLLNLIEKQDKVIDRMINWIERDCYYQDEFGNSCSIIQDSCFSNKDCKECIKEYFMEVKE